MKNIEHLISDVNSFAEWFCEHVECEECPVKTNSIERRTLHDRCIKHISCSDSNLAWWFNQENILLSNE